jgi:hypothetical protein
MYRMSLVACFQSHEPLIYPEMLARSALRQAALCRVLADSGSALPVRERLQCTRLQPSPLCS